MGKKSQQCKKTSCQIFLFSSKTATESLKSCSTFCFDLQFCVKSFCAQPAYNYYFKKPYVVESYIRSSYIEPLIWKKYVKVVRLKIAKNTSYRKYCADGEEKRPDLWHWIRWHKAFYGHDLFEVQEPFSISW